MGVPIGLTFDAGDPERLGTFWCLVLGYMERPPPEGYDSWEQYDAANGTPGNEAAVAPLVAAGATTRNRSTDPDDFFIVMLDPEGNEFCLV